MIITQDQKIRNSMDRFCKEHQIGQIMRRSNIKKEKGIPPLFLFKYIFLLVFMGRNLYRLLQGDAILGEGTEKDTVYRFLNSPTYNWRKFLLLLSSAILNSVSLLTSRDKVFIFDDSLYSRNRSKKVELLARVYDHVERRFCKGFRMLTLGWSDGATFVPVSFSLLSSEEEKNRICGLNEGIDKRTNGYKRRCEGIRKATDVLFKLLQQAKSYGITAQYVLFDSWFSFPGVIQRVLQSGFNVICMLKKMPHVR
ncbi:MAG: transposase, partial [Nitrospirae bacterium]|nr:transposase [Nitrospirota bacterium]